MSTHTAYSLIAFELQRDDTDSSTTYADIWYDDIAATTTGIIGPLQLEANEIGKADILEALIGTQDLRALYDAGQPEPQPNIVIMPTVVVALVKITWTHTNTPEGEDFDVYYDVVRFFQENEFKDALAAMVPPKATSQPTST